ncbi:hypothetical protein LUZ60_003163 [Juncus effusus]|nr:hypothetical protein LUZ60_003163 [Juncus effusus]
MGVSSMAGASEGIQLCVFDLRRGQQEGQELDKILFFYPADCPFPTQLSVIGLCEGMITFTRIFSPDSACEVIEGEKHSHVFYEAEPDIWMVLVVEKAKEKEPVWRVDALKTVLKEIHSLFKMFNGSINSLLEKQVSGQLARSHLHSFISDYLTDFNVGKKIQMPSFRDSLKERGTVQMLTVSREVALEVQSIITAIGPSYNSLVLFQDLLVSTTLPPDDTTNLFTYSILRLTPHALSLNTTTWSYLRKGPSIEEPLNQGQNRNSDGMIQRPMQRDKWPRGKDGFLFPDFAESGFGFPVLLEKGERMYLCPYQHKGLTVLVLLPVSSLPGGEQGLVQVKKQLIETVSDRIVKLESKLARGWGGENAYHVSGYRYLIIDNNTQISRFTPPGKVTTLTKDSLLWMNKVREEVDLEKGRWKRENNDNYEKDFEICIRGNNNAWLIAKIIRGKELYMVLEKANETLLYATETVEKFSNRYCEGAFSMDY